MTAQVTNFTNEIPQRRMHGNCKWFDGVRGFGFISGTDGRDYFVHQTSIKSKGWRNLEINQEVEFEVVMDKDRLKAINVTAPGGTLFECEQTRQREVCFEYKKGGTCLYGTSCKYSHNRSDINKYSISGNPWSRSKIPVPSLVSERGSKGVCYAWRRGECYRGEKCKFDHPKDQENCHLPDNSQGVCYLWQEGHCHKEGKCPFIHFPTE